MKIRETTNKRIFKASVMLLAVWSMGFYLLPTATAHRFHTSLTRIDYNSELKIYEITIQLFTHDLKPILGKRSGKRVELEKTSDVDKLILSYLNEHFALTDKKGEVKTLKWIGKEVEIDSVRIYLETVATENPESYQLKNTIFLENFPEQVNLVVCRYDGKKADLMFKAGDKIKEIIENKPSAED